MDSSANPISGDQVEDPEWRETLHLQARPRIINKIVETLRKQLPNPIPEGGLNELEKIATRFEEGIYSTATSQMEYLRKISLKMLSMETKVQNPGPQIIPNFQNPNFQNHNLQNHNLQNPNLQNRNLQNRNLQNRNLQNHNLQNPNLQNLNLQNRNLQNPNLQNPNDQIQNPNIQDLQNPNPDWRLTLQPESRQRIINKISDSLRRHLSFPPPYDLRYIHIIALRFEERIYISATSQADYLRKISLKMLSLEIKAYQDRTEIDMSELSEAPAVSED